jgi:mannosyltransferase
MSAWRGLPLLLPVLAAGVFLRAWGLGTQPLWFDEALSWRLMDFSFPEMMRVVASPGSSHPPLYYLLLRAWVALWGDSEVALRSLAVVCGAVTVLGAYWMTYEAALLGGPAPAEGPGRAHPAALLAAAFVALSVGQVHAARQARMYSLGTALLALDSTLLLHALRGAPYRRVCWVLYGLTAVAFCYTHALGTFALAAQALFIGWYLSRGPRQAGAAASQWRWAAGAGALIALCCLPLLRLLARKAAGITWQVAPTAEGVARETALAWLTTFATPLEIDPAVAWGVTAAALALPAWLAARSSWPERFLGLTCLALAGLMLGYSFATGRSVFLARHLAFAHLLWLAALAYWASGLRPAPRAALLAGLALVWGAVSYPSALPVLGPEADPGMRAAAEYVARRRGPDEPVLAQRTITLIKALYYLPSGARPRLCAAIPSRRAQTQAEWLRDADLIAAADAISGDAPGVWALSTSWYDETTEITFPLPGNWELVDQAAFPQDYPGEGPVQVWHFRARGAGGLAAR